MAPATVTGSAAPSLATERLLLRHWHDRDRAPFAAMNADPRVMEYFEAPLTREESDGSVDRNASELARRPFGLWAVEVRATGEFAGFVGLDVPRFDASFTPTVEVGWRIAHAAWGHGYATEAATEALRHGFETVGLDEIVSFTTVANRRSERVMQRLGMVHSGEFDHPNVPRGHRVCRHVLYRSTRAQWRERA
jgi:RimJ/RimL family protein N-acetyltransferase